MVHYVLLWESPGSGRPGLTQFWDPAGGDPHLMAGRPSPLIISHDRRSGLSRIAHPSSFHR